MSYLREMAEQGYSPDTIGPFYRHMHPWLLRKSGVGVDETVLDIGAGQGHGLLPLHSAGWRHLIALDRDDENFDLFGRRFGIATLRCDIGTERIELPDGGIGAILCFHLVEHLLDPTNLLSESRRVLKKGGKLFLVSPDWRKQMRTFWRDPTHLHPYDKESIARLLRMHDFNCAVHSWGPRYGFGRIQAYRWIPEIGMIGVDMLAVGTAI